jgi:two-component system LytT family sensor kinase
VSKTISGRRIREWLTICAICLMLGTAYSISDRMRRLLRGEPADWSTLPTGELLHFGTWVLLYPLVAALAARFPLGERRRRAVLVHLLAALVFSPLLMTVTQLLRAALSGNHQQGGLARLFTEVIVPEYAWGMTAYVVLLSVASAIEWRQRDQRRALEAAQLEAALAVARLQALRRQIQPHFLFNALNSVSSLLRRDPDGAERMVARLGDFLRLVLDDTMPQEVALRDEIELLDSYLAIERVRFRDRLSVTIEVPGGLLDAKVPCLVLQPLFENSIRHGIVQNAGPLRVALRASHENGRLRLVVEDDGARSSAAPGPAAPASAGIGLANIRGRLEQLYGSRASLAIEPAADRGVRVVIDLPREAGAATGREGAGAS